MKIFYLPGDKGKEKVDDTRVKSVLIKPLIVSSKEFNTILPLNKDFLEKLTKKLGTLKTNNSIEVINEDSDNYEELITQFNEDKIEMTKPMVSQPLPTGRYYYP